MSVHSPLASHAKGLLLALLLPLAACQQSVESPPPTIRVGHAPHDHHSPLYIAAMNPDYFREHGGIYLKEVRFREEYQLLDQDKVIANVLLTSSTGGAIIIRRLIEQQLDMTYGGVPAILKGIDRGERIHMVAPVMAEGAGLVMKTQLPINNWSEFVDHARNSERPLRIGYKSAVSVQGLIFERALDASGIGYSNDLANSSARVHLINMNGAKNLMPSMENGLIDGYVIMQPYLAIAETNGSGKVISHLRDMPPAGKWHKHPCCALAASDSFTRNHPDVSRKLLTLLNQARGFVRDHPDKSAAQVATWLGIDIEVEQRSLPTIDFTVSLDQSWNDGLDFWIDEMIAAGKLSAAVRNARQNGNTEALLYDMEIYNSTRGSK